MTDFRIAIRTLARTPGYSFGVIAVLALGIGANAAVFSALDQVVIRPLPYAQPDRLAAVWEDFSAFGTPRTRVSPRTFLDWRERTRTFGDLAAYRLSGLTITGGGEPEALAGIAVTANLLPLLGVPPALGRTFSPDEEAPGHRLVVISHRLWQRRLGGDPGVLSAVIRLNDEPYTVIGVMPPGFQFPDGHTEYWVPLGLAPELAARRNSHFLYVVGRLGDGRSWAEAQADMSGIAARLATEHPATNARVGVLVRPLKDEVLAGAETSLLVLLGAAACVLLIACANVANLALARASRRLHEIGVRMALGASRRRVAGAMLLEHVLLAAAGGLAGLAIARWSLATLQWLVPAGVTGAARLHIDARVITVAAAAAGLSAVVCGAAPVLLYAAESALGAVTSASPRTASRAGGRLRHALVVCEIAVALVLLVAAGLLIDTLVRLRSVDTGFQSTRVLTASIDAPYPKYEDPEVRRQFYERIVAAVRAIPGAASVGLTSDLPYTSRGNTMSIRIEHREQEAGLGRDALFRIVSLHYLQTLGARLVAGRLLGDQDEAGAPPVVVVNESFARQYFGVASPLGRRIDSGTGTGAPVWMTIVGVVADVRERGADLASKPAVYVPFTQTGISFFQPSEIAVRTSVDPLSMANALRRAVWSVDAQEPVSAIRTLDDIVDADLLERRQVLTLVAVFSAVALLLAAVGLYSVLSYLVADTRRDIGIRLAIGASPRLVVAGIVRQAAWLTAAGIAAGIAGAGALTRLMQGLLFEVSPVDPRVIGAVSVLLAAVALLAAYLPARRAASTDPATVLRTE